MYNGLFILVVLVSSIYARDITTISYNDRHNLAEKRLTDVFKNEGAFVRHDVKEFIFNQRKFQAIAGLPFEFSSSIMFLQGNAENCLRKETYPEFLLPDGSFRRTLAVDGQNFEE